MYTMRYYGDRCGVLTMCHQGCITGLKGAIGVLMRREQLTPPSCRLRPHQSGYRGCLAGAWHTTDVHHALLAIAEAF